MAMEDFTRHGRTLEFAESPGDAEPPFPEPPIVFVSTTWEYRDVARRAPDEALPDEAELEALGAEGWELVAVLEQDGTVHFYFKRPAG